MSRAAFVTRQFRCLRCCGTSQLSTQHFSAQFWTGASTFAGKPLSPTYRDIRCPSCNANPAWFEPWPRVCANFLLPMREELRPVVFKRVDEYGRAHYRYPSSTDPNDFVTDIKPDPDGKYTIRDSRGGQVRVNDIREVTQIITGDWRHNGALPRPNEERVDFPTLRSMEAFLKEQNPGYRDWQVPLNDLLDYDNPDTAINEDDPGAADDVEAIAMTDGGITSEDEVRAFMARDDARALIESA